MESAEYQVFAKKVESNLKSWKDKYLPYLKSLDQGCNHKEVISEISEELLSIFSKIPLIDKYDVYQHLMNYWSDVMQDDIYQISAEGWKDSAQIRQIIDKKEEGKKVKETPDIVVGTGKKAKKFKSELIPPYLIMQTYFSDEKNAIDKLEAQKRQLPRKLKIPH